MTEKQFVKSFVLKQFHCSEYFFETAWKQTANDYRKSTNLTIWRERLSVLYDRSKTDKQRKTKKAISIFFEAFKELAKTGGVQQVSVVFEEIINKHKAEEEIRSEILKDISVRIKEIHNILKNVPTKSEGEKVEINFTETELQMSGQKPLSKDNPFILAEYIILREKVHWLWSFVILPEFKTNRPKWQFRNYISKKKSILKENGISIAALKKIDDDYGVLEAIDGSIKSNILDVKNWFSNATSFIEKNKFKEAITELSNITKPHYKWYSFTDAYMKLIEWIRMNNFDGVSQQVIEICRIFTSWYSKRLRVGLLRIEYYNKKLSRDKNKLDKLTEEELHKIKDELCKVEDNLKALMEKIPLSSQDAKYQEFVEFLIDIQEKLNYVMEQETVSEEKRQEVCIQVIIKSQNKNEHFNSLIEEAFEKIGDKSYKLDEKAKKSRSDKILQDESKEIYWFICELSIALENFDSFEFTQGSKLGMLINYFKEGMENKINKWLKGRL